MPGYHLALYKLCRYIDNQNQVLDMDLTQFHGNSGDSHTQIVNPVTRKKKKLRLKNSYLTLESERYQRSRYLIEINRIKGKLQNQVKIIK